MARATCQFAQKGHLTVAAKELRVRDGAVYRPELLAPAGGMDALRAAVAAGADAVYLGLGELNARRGAENFDLETLAEACRFAHLHDRKVYLTANVAILPSEIESALHLVDAAWAAGVDAVIVQDLGLLRGLRRELPEVRVHASTQLNTHSSDTLRSLASLGVSRVTLARETSLDEIALLSTVGHGLGVQAESFVHGAICVCYSGQCLLSSMIGGRSANRGLCAQPCRLPYELVDDAGSVLGDVGAYLLSPKDLAGISVLPRYVSGRVDSLKIEGRMKSAEYVALVTGVYRAALDRAVALPGEYEPRSGEVSVLSEAFSRGFTEAYLVGERGNDMMSYRRPNNRGVPVGRVAEVGGGRVKLTLDVSVDSDDTIEFWTSQGRFAQRVGPLEYESHEHSSAPAGQKVSISAEQAVSSGDRVFRVRNAALSAAAERLYVGTSGPSVPLQFRVRVVVGEPLVVEVFDERGRSGGASGPIVEQARTRAVTAEEIAAHVGRLGGTPYVPRSWDIELTPGAGVGFSAVHAIRRNALADYEQAVLSPWADRALKHPRLPRLPRRASVRSERVQLVVSVASLDSAEACLAAGADSVHVPSWAIPVGEKAPIGVVPVVPRVCHDVEADRLMEAPRSSGVAVAGTLGALWRLAEEGCAVQAHWSLNALNAHSVATLADLGASLVWLSPELSISQVSAIAAESALPLGVAVAGRQELMVTEHCVLMSEGECGRRCETCVRRQATRLLRDRKGYEFPLKTDPLGRTHLYNAVSLDASSALVALLQAGIAAVRVDAEAETARDAAELTMRTREALKAAARGHDVGKSSEGTTSGHFFRGVR